MLLFTLPLLVWLGQALAGQLDTASTFLNPAADHRPFFRYWLPDASVDPEVVAADIKSAAAIGAGGIELVPFYGYGGELGVYPPGVDWSVNGFGTEAYRGVFGAVLQAAKEAGVKVDIPLGPNQGQGVPAREDDEGLQWDLISASTILPANGTFKGLVPGWGQGEFVGLVGAQVKREENVSTPTSQFEPPTYTQYKRLELSYESLVDLGANVSVNGETTLEFPQAGATTGYEYRLFAFYQRRTLNRNLQFPNNRTQTIFDNGSYVVDHFSARGAETLTEFWEQHLLTDETEDLLREVGSYVWEDSMEIKSNISWTPGLPSLFEKELGYSLVRYLPLIMWGNNNLNMQKSDPGCIQCVLDTPDGGSGYVNDFRRALGSGYQDYLGALREWASERLGLQFSAQVSYNLPMDTPANVPFVDAPECESLQFEDRVDAYRQFSGPANLAGRNIISNELGARMWSAYQQPLSELLYSIHRAVSGGVNRFVLHGQTYSGEYPGSTWPGYTTFSFLFSEMWSNKQPAWEYGLPDVLHYIGRLQRVQQMGTPKVDVAVYFNPSVLDPSFAQVFPFGYLVAEGWTYSFLGSENLKLPQAQISHGILAPDGPAYKAMVLTADSNLTLSAVNKLKEFAVAGLPIIISGAPGYYANGGSEDKSAIQVALKELQRSKHVYNAHNISIADTLRSLDLQPRVRLFTNGTWRTTWREDAGPRMSYAFIFCDGPAAAGDVQITGISQIPYFFDAWAGEQHPVLEYTQDESSNTTRIPLQLASNQTVVLAFSHQPIPGAASATVHAIELPTNIVGYRYEVDGRALVLQVGDAASASAEQHIHLSTGKTVALSQVPSLPEPFTLSNWTLVAEHWTPPNSMSGSSVAASQSRHNTTHHFSGPELPPWPSVSGLEHAAGIGYYSTSFYWPPPPPPPSSNNGQSSSSHKYSARLRFQDSLLSGGRVYLNGEPLPPLDASGGAGAVDVNMISRGTGSVLLQPGSINTLTIVTPTRLWNQVRAVWDLVKDGGQTPTLSDLSPDLPPRLEMDGLVGTVTVVPVVEMTVWEEDDHSDSRE